MTTATSTPSQPTCIICGSSYNTVQIGSHVVCNNCIYAGSNRIRGYHYKPAPDFHGKHDRYFGVEIEVVPGVRTQTGQSFCAELVTKHFGDLAYLKTDSSIPTHGFEIVTHPFTLHTMYSKRMFSKLSNMPLRSYSEPSCGLHVHASRTGLKDIHLAKLAYFFALPVNENFIKHIGQRDWNRYCRKHQKGQMKDDYKGRNTRYMAINFTNRATVEFRFFRGNTKSAAITRAVQFCDAILEFVKVTTATKMNFREFANWLNNMETGRYKYNALRTHVNAFLK